MSMWKTRTKAMREKKQGTLLNRVIRTGLTEMEQRAAGGWSKLDRDPEQTHRASASKAHARTSKDISEAAVY